MMMNDDGTQKRGSSYHCKYRFQQNISFNMNPPVADVEALAFEHFKVFVAGLVIVWFNLCNERFRGEFFQAVDSVLARSGRDVNGPWKGQICLQAARFGHCKVLEWCRLNNFPWNIFECLTIAMTNGHVNIIKWMRQVTPFNEDICVAAALSGNLRILQWCRKQGCPWNEKTCHAAAMKGHLKLLKWCRENGCPWDKRTCAIAAEHCQIHVYKWCLQNGCPCDTGETVSLDGEIGRLVRVNPEHLMQPRFPADDEDEDESEGEDEYYSDSENDEGESNH